MERLSRNGIGILNLFRKNIFLSGSIREIAALLKKPYPKVYEAAKELERRNVIHLRKAGNASLCEIMLSKEAVSVLSFLDGQEAISRNIPNMEKILEFREFLDDIIVVAGSYAKGRQTPKSDIDLVLITKEGAARKQKLLENMTMTFLPRIHAVTFSYKDFVDMLLSRDENFGKEVFRNHLIFRNTERYYLLLKEAIENGFRSKNLS